MDKLLIVLASELPIISHKGSYRYLKEVVSHGQYYQVAWQQINNDYLALYGRQDLPTLIKAPLIFDFPSEQEDQ